ncbi:MAG: GyrI-like domain-containing protein [Methanomassiliicoccales archaeon]|nr:GyrI-like domain-containing protein [Methanomassiliicoccales archaeon]
MVDIKVVTTKTQKAIAIRDKVKIKDVPQAMGGIFGELGPLLANEVKCTGPPFALYHSWSDDEVDMEVGFPIAEGEITKGRVRTIELPAVKAAVAMHVGPYENLADTYGHMMTWITENGHHPADYMWEEYLNSPDDTPKDQLMTRLFWPIM